MTVSTTDSRVAYTCNGSTVAFSFPYLFLADADLVVLLVDTSTTPNTETTLALTTDYTVTGAGNPAGGTVTTTVAYSAGYNLVIYRDTALTQGLDLVANDPLPAEDLEQALDRRTLVSQRLADLQSRSVRLSDGDTSGANPVLPTPAPLEHVRWNAAGTALESVKLVNTDTIAVTPFTETLLDDANADAAKGTLRLQVDGLAALRALTGQVDGEHAYLTYHTAEGDGGAGAFRWVSGAAPGTYTDDNGAIVLPTGGDGSAAWLRNAYGSVSIKWFGAVGDGAANDTVPVKAAIQYAINRRSLVGSGTFVNRGTPTVYVPHGMYLVDPEVLSSYSETDVRTLLIRGDGMYNSLIVLNGDGALGKYTAQAKLLFPVFKDLAFYGDTFLDTTAIDATNPVNANRKCFWCNAPSGVQGFKFYSCLFSRFGETFILEGEDNEADNKWFGCKVVHNGDWLVVSNPQSLNNEHFGTDIEQYVGSLVRIPATDYSGDTGGSSGGGSIRFYGGSIIPYDAGTRRYLVEIGKGVATFSQPVVLTEGVKFELRYYNNGIVKIDPDQNAHVVFNNSTFLFAYSTGGIRELCSIGRWARLEFNNGYFKDQDTGVTRQWTLIGNASPTGEMGHLLFDGCQGAPDPTEINLDATGAFHGVAIARNTKPIEYWAAGEVTAVPDWTVSDDWWKFHGYTKEGVPVHRAFMTDNWFPYNATSPGTIVLPENAVILRFVVYVPPQGASTASITYSVDDLNAVNFFTHTVAQQMDGTYVEIPPSVLTGGLGQAVIGATVNERTLVLSANAGAHQAGRGIAFVEYM